MMRSSHSNKLSIPAPEKLKIADGIESIGEKSLMNMPEEVIERIFSFTELADQKSLSESCRKLNTIFGRRRILNGAWLVVKDQIDTDKQNLSNSTRSYTKLHWNAPIPVSMWKNLAPSLTYLSINFTSGDDLQHAIVSALPFLTELTLLDFSCNDSLIQEANLQLEPPKIIKHVLLKKLEYLKINCMFMLFLHNRFIQIDSENLHTIIFEGENRQVLEDHAQNTCYDDVRELIARQKNLRVLHLYVLEEFFNRPFVIYGKLRELRGFRSVSQILEFTREQETNIYDFLMSQNELEILPLRCVMKNPSVKVKKLIQWLQHLKLKWKSLIIINDDCPNFFLEKVTVEEVQNHQQMSTVEELVVTCVETSLSAAEIQTLFSQIATKFPNVTNMFIHSQFSVDFTLVNGLSNIRKLKFHGRQDWSLLKSSTIPNLETFIFMLTCYDIAQLNCEKANVIDFLVRHKTLKRIDVNFLDREFVLSNSVAIQNTHEDEIFFIQSLTEILRTVLMYVSDLKMFSVNLMSEQKSNWNHDFNLHRTIHSLMIEHARPGFVYSYGSHEVLKRDDSKLVVKKNGRWTEMK